MVFYEISSPRQLTGVWGLGLVLVMIRSEVHTETFPCSPLFPVMVNYSVSLFLSLSLGLPC